MNVKELLIAARAKIENPEHWCMENIAEDAEGNDVHWCDYNAVRWCAVGAISCIGREATGAVEAEALYRIAAHGGVTNLVWSKTHAEVLEAFDAAIADCDNSPSYSVLYDEQQSLPL